MPRLLSFAVLLATWWIGSLLAGDAKLPPPPIVLAAMIAEEAFDGLDAPIMRLAAPDVPSFPYADPLEEYCLPNAEKIVAALAPKKLSASK